MVKTTSGPGEARWKRKRHNKVTLLPSTPPPHLTTGPDNRAPDLPQIIRDLKEENLALRQALARLQRVKRLVPHPRPSRTRGGNADDPARESEDKFRRLIEVSPQPLSVDDLAGRIEYLNRKFVETFGYTHREVPTSVAWFRKAYPDGAYRKQVGIKWEAMKRALRAGREPAPVEAEVVCKDGTRRTVEFSGTFIGRRLIIAASDVTARKRAEQEARNNLRFLQTLLNAIPSPVFYKNATGLYLGCNKAFERFLGLPQDKIVGKTVSQIAPRELARKYHQADEVLLKTGGVQTYESSVRSADGKIRQVIFNKATFRDADGKVAGLVGAILDITERKRAEESLRQSEERYRRLVDISPDAICISRKKRMVFANHAALRLFGAKCAEDLRDKSPFDLVHPEGHDDLAERLRLVEEEGRSVPIVERRIRRLDGAERFVEVAAAPFTEEGTVSTLVVLHDITDRKRLEKEVLEISEREQRRIGRDLHDGLCQILSSAKFSVGLLEQRLRERGAAEAGAAGRIESLLGTAIQEARSLARGLHPVSLDEGGLTGALQELAATAAELHGISCRCRFSAPISIRDHAVANHLYRIAQEALANAIKHGKASTVSIHLDKFQHQLALTIHDNGVGLPPNARERSGMGLRTMEHRAHIIGGILQVHRRRHRGTTVACCLCKHP